MSDEYSHDEEFDFGSAYLIERSAIDQEKKVVGYVANHPIVLERRSPSPDEERHSKLSLFDISY